MNATMAVAKLYAILARQKSSSDYDGEDGQLLMDDIDYEKVATNPMVDAAAKQFMQLMANVVPEQLPFRPSMPEYTDVLPPPNHDDVQVQVMAFGYMLLFLLGTCGNVAVLTMVTTMVRSRRAHLDNTLIYMVVLSCVDFGVCLSLPFTVIDQILGFWMFGSTMCKLHAVLENFGKVLSALIITAMSFDRFAGVCLSHIRWLRSRRLAICILIGMAIYALVALCPLLLNFKAREVILFQKETGPNKITRMRIEKCTMTTKFRSQIPLMRISLYTLAVACFYFICWTPFWVATAFAVYLEYAGEHNGAVPPIFVYCMYFIHALPFTNSAINWILYGAMNGQLQQRIRHSGVTGTTNNAALTTLSMALCRSQQQSAVPPPPEFFIDHRTTTLLNGGNGSSTLSSTTVAITSSNGGCHANGTAVVGAAQQMTPSDVTTPALLLKAYEAAGCYRRKSSSCSMNVLNSLNSSTAAGLDGGGAPIKAAYDLTQEVLEKVSAAVVAGKEQQQQQVEGVQNELNEQQKQHQQQHQQQHEDTSQLPNWAASSSAEAEAEANTDHFPGDADDDEAAAVVHEQTLLLHSSDSMDMLLRIDCESTTFL
ncbi:hypothetical protein niasHS_005459 [Heterodera schachtii]|uniref:G-protein coupled receptors family 1 profile domain-containing protein n=1 Tax=Heterodera schachtii TaxID=97005 RepID=A0ABD2JJ32_HETSC